MYNNRNLNSKIVAIEERRGRNTRTGRVRHDKPLFFKTRLTVLLLIHRIIRKILLLFSALSPHSMTTAKVTPTPSVTPTPNVTGELCKTIKEKF